MRSVSKTKAGVSLGTSHHLINILANSCSEKNTYVGSTVWLIKHSLNRRQNKKYTVYKNKCGH